MKLRGILMLMMLLVAGSVYSQQHYPVQVQSTITFPSAFLTDYSDPANINVRVYLSDLNKDNYKILLKINLTDRKSVNLVSIRGVELTLQKGQIYFLNDLELATLFDPNNLKSKDNNVAVIDESLSEGIYHLSFEAVDAKVPEVVVSNPRTDFTVFSINRYDPPMLTSPVDKQSFDLQTINQNVFFNWQPRHVSFSPQQKIKYNFRLIKVVPIDRNPYDAMKNTPANTSNSIIDAQGLDFPVFIYTPADIPLEEGNVYAWQVTAYEESSGGKTSSQRFKNSGASEVFTFSIKENCQPVSDIAEPEIINNNLIALSWGEDASHVMYEVAYRPANTSLPWTPVLTANNTLTLDRTVLQEGVKYEYTIRAQCKTWTQPSYGGTFILETPNCIAPEPIMADSKGEKLLLSWEPITGVSAYRFQYKLLDDASAEYTSIELAGTSREYSLDKNNYLIKIDALCGTDVAQGKAYEVLQDDNGLVSPCPIPAPFQFMAQRILGDTASLRWNVNNENKIYSGYKISWWPKDSADYKTHHTVNEPQLIGTKIYDDQLYAYQITFQCGTKESVTPVGMFRIEGANGTVTIEEGTADCFPPAVLQGEARSTTSALFEWSKVEGAEDYQLFYAPKGEKVFKTFNTISKSAILKDLEDSKLYQFVVRCRCGGKYSIFSDTALVDLSKGKVNAACDSSQFFISDAQTTTNIRLCWKYDTLHTGYKITYRDENQAPSDEYTIAYTNLDTLNNLKDGDTLKYTVQNLKSGTAYIFKLQTLCETDEALKNAPLKVSTQPDTKSSGNCEGSNLCDRTNTTPLTTLAQGDTIHCADYQIEITEITASNSTDGIYTGKGTMVMPIAGIGDFVSVNVSFENVKINAKPNTCVYDGTINIENVNASVLPEELRDKVREMDGKITELINDANQLMSDINNGIKDAKDATQDAIDYFQGGDNVGGVKDGNLGEKEVSADIPKGTTSASVTATSVTIGGEEITVTSFPVLIKDKDGEIFQVISTGKVTHVGTYDPELVKEENQKLEEGSVVFEENTSAKYDFDAYKSMYAKSEQISRKYEALNGNYYVPSKLLLPGETDLVNAKLSSSTYKSDNIKFANGKGAVFNHTSTGNTFTITVSGGPAGDAQEVYAWYVNGTEKKIIGKLLVPSYAPKQKRVVIIPVGQSVIDVSKYQKGLNDAYAKLGITYTVSVDDSFKDNLDWDMDGDGKVQAKGSKLISNDYQGEEAAMIEAYVAAKGGEGNIDPETGYFFAVYEASNLEDNLLGKMPAQEQFGLLYVGGASEASLVRTIAHEIGHGAYHLEHSFNSIYLGDNSKSTTANLMDYKDGNELWKYQWDIVHDPGHVWGILKRDKDQFLLVDNYYFDPGGVPFKIKTGYWDDLKIIIDKDGILANTFPNGAVYGWKVINNGKVLEEYLAKIENGYFKGYYNLADGELYQDGETFIDGYSFELNGINKTLSQVKYMGCQQVYFKTEYTIRGYRPSAVDYKTGKVRVLNFLDNYLKTLLYKVEKIDNCTSTGEDKFVAGEYDSYDSYKKILGNFAKSETSNDWNGAWLKSDRLNRTDRWKKAMETITKNRWKGVLKPFYQVSDYYLWCQWKAKQLGHEVKWGMGAAYLVDDLGDSYQSASESASAMTSVGTTTGNVLDIGERMGESILSELNIGILNYAIERFNELLFGKYSQTPLTGTKAYDWDISFIQHEQVEVAAEVYPLYEGTKELDYLQDITRKQGIIGTGSVFIARLIPDFSLVGIDIETSESRFGEIGRAQIPILMLYPTVHKITDDLIRKMHPYQIKFPDEFKNCLNDDGSLNCSFKLQTDSFVSPPGKIYDIPFAAQCIKANESIQEFFNNAILSFK